MTTHSSTLACKIPWTEQLSRLQFMGSQRVGYDFLHWLFTYNCFGFIHIYIYIYIYTHVYKMPSENRDKINSFFLI